MAKLDKIVKLYKPGVDAVAVAGTDAELNGYKLQGWSEKKPKGSGQSSTPAGGKPSATPAAGKKKD